MNDLLRDADIDGAAAGLRLDARQRAMLEEMGVKVWAPVARVAAGQPRPGQEAQDRRAAPEPSSSARLTAALPAGADQEQRQASASSASIVSAASARFVESTPAAPADPRPAPPPREPAAGASPRTAPDLASIVFEPPQRLYTRLDEDGIAPPVEGGWLVVADMPPDADGRPGEPFAGEAGRLLDNMLRALRLHEAPAAVHLMRVHRGGGGGVGGGGVAGGAGGVGGQGGQPGSPDEPFAALARELAPRVVLAMGPLAAQGLLRSGEPLGRLRGRAVPLASAHAALDGVPVVATYHPAYLLRNPADKARAWADLCLAADRFAP